VTAQPGSRVQEVAGRNAPCPCGSGRRYKQCCGAPESREIAPKSGGLWSFAQLRLAALQHHRAGRLDEAYDLYVKALAIDEDDGDVLHMAGIILLHRGQLREALTMVRKAGRLSDWALPGIQHNLGLVIGAMLAGTGASTAARLRAAGAAFIEAREARRRAVQPLVSVVVPSYNHAQFLRPALESVFRQSYRNIELIVVDDGSRDGSPQLAREILGECPFSHRFTARENRGAPVTLNEAIRQSTGDYVNILNSDDCFEPSRLEEMVEAVAATDADWGFSAVSCIDGSGVPIKDAEDPRAAWIAGAGDLIRESDTVGSALLGESNVAVSTGNLFFSRRLFDLLDGFGNHRYNHDWDFCLRALWRSEPCYVSRSLYRYRVHANNTIKERSSEIRREALSTLSAYHSLALTQRPINPLAPSRHNLGIRYGAHHLAMGGGDAFPREALLELAAELDMDRSQSGAVPLLPHGLNLVGYVRGEFGLGISVRALARACLANDFPVCLLDVDVKLGSRQAERSMDAHIVDAIRYRNTLFYFNPDQQKTVWGRFGGPGSENQRKIGYWYWELEKFPAQYLYAFDLVDEVWVASEFVRAAVASATAKPVIKIPHSVVVPLSRPYERREFGLPEGAFLFLFTFDFNSFTERKNPDAVILAFRRAFPTGNEPVRLVVKCASGRTHPERWAALRQATESDSRIVLLDALLEHDALHGLQSVCDAYVSLHRSEGLGLGMAECMALGKPVIATGYSGNLEFMSHRNSCLVDFRMVPVRPGEYIYYEDHWFWADADVDHAAHFMRKVVADDEFRNAIARQAKSDMATRFSEAATVAAIRRRFAELGVDVPGPAARTVARA